MKRISNISTLFILSFVFVLSGCTVIFQSGRRSDTEKIEQLSGQLNDLEQAKKLLEERLSQEIANKDVRLDMLEKGLVITFVADVLFDSGKAKLKSESLVSIDKVARILEENVPDLNIGIEGHTDNVPIKFSSWKDNWELSAERSLSVLRYLIQQKNLAPSRVRATGFGDTMPVASNDTVEGRKANRRVEIVILPKISKIADLKHPASVKEESELIEPKDNLK
jgi:chemotaxis protein MotB